MSEQTSRDVNEIDLKDLLRAILDTKSWVVIALVVVTVGYWTVQMVLNLARPTVHAYQTRVDLVFKGVDEGEYPNESPFSISDIIAPVVLNQVYDNNHLEEFINRQDFVSAFSIAPYTPDRDLILEKYADRLSASNLSNAEINALQGELNAELAKAASDSAAITFASTKVNEVPRELVSKILSDVPAEWARHMIEDVGVARFDIQIYTAKVMDLQLIESIDYLIAFEMLLDRLRLLEENVAKIREIPSGLVVVDEETGFSLPDLEKAILDVRRYRVAPLVNPVRSLGIAKNPELVKLYFENELIILNRQRDTQEQKKKNIEDAYGNYMRYQSGGRAASGTSQGGVQSGSMIPQFGAEFLDRIVEMTNAGADIKYRQDLNTKLLEISDRLADTTGEITRIKEIISSMEGNNQATQSLRENYTEQVNENLPVLIEQLRRYFEISNRLYAKLSRDDLGSAGYMYRAADGNVTYQESRNILSSANIRLYLIFAFLAVVVVIPVAMVRNAMKTS